MSGQIAIRGFVIQTLICILKILKEDFDRITLEPIEDEHDLDTTKVDILIQYADGTKKALQVKSTDDIFGKADVTNWYKSLSEEKSISDFEIVLVGNVRNILKKESNPYYVDGTPVYWSQVCETKEDLENLCIQELSFLHSSDNSDILFEESIYSFLNELNGSMLKDSICGKTHLKNELIELFKKTLARNEEGNKAIFSANLFHLNDQRIFSVKSKINLGLFDEALVELNKISTDDDKINSYIKFLKALICFYKQQQNKGLQILKELVQSNQNGANYNYLASYYKLVDDIDESEKNYEKALNYFDKADKEYFSSDEINIGKASIRGNLSLIYDRKGELEKSLFELESSVEIFSQVGSLSIPISLKKIGNEINLLNRYRIYGDERYQSLTESINKQLSSIESEGNEVKKLKVHFNECQALHNFDLGNEVCKNNIDLALGYAENGVCSKNLCNSLLDHKGVICNDLDSLKKAHSHRLRTYQSFKTVTNGKNLFNSYLHLGNYYSKTDFSTADEYYNYALEIGEQLNSTKDNIHLKVLNGKAVFSLVTLHLKYNRIDINKAVQTLQKVFFLFLEASKQFPLLYFSELWKTSIVLLKNSSQVDLNNLNQVLGTVESQYVLTLKEKEVKQVFEEICSLNSAQLWEMISLRETLSHLERFSSLAPTIDVSWLKMDFYLKYALQNNGGHQISPSFNNTGKREAMEYFFKSLDIILSKDSERRKNERKELIAFIKNKILSSSVLTDEDKLQLKNKTNANNMYSA